METRRSQDRLSSIEDWLYVVIVGALASYFVIGIVAWTWMLLVGIAAPEAFTTILATVAGGLVGILTPLGGRSTRPSEEEPLDNVTRPGSPG